MDFFETRERYRRQEARGYMAWLVRLIVIGLALWLGWEWGGLDTRRLQLDAELALEESRQDNQRLKQEFDQLSKRYQELIAARSFGAEEAIIENERLAKLVRRQLVNGVRIEQIYEAVQKSSPPVNCRLVEEVDMSVSTPLYNSPESRLALFDGGLRVSLEGQSEVNGNKTSPNFDANQPIDVRLIYLGGQKIETGTLPLDLSVAAENWLLDMNFTRSVLPGYVSMQVRLCAIR